MTTPPTIITIDGPAGVGKTTLARYLADFLGICFLDTGAMFRSVAIGLGQKSLEWSEEKIEQNLQGKTFSLICQGSQSQLLLDGRPMGEDIRSEDVGLLASKLAQKLSVRAYLKKNQQTLGTRYSMVAEGRDMGTTVFPYARWKFFLDASPEERGLRRYLQLQAMGQGEKLEEIIKKIRLRDDQDRNRSIAPLRPAKDAVIIDTTSSDLNQVKAALVRYITEI